MIKNLLTILLIIPSSLLAAYPPPCIPLSPQDKSCMAIAVYKEARGEPLKGQRAVLDVILNRSAQSGLDVCSIVNQQGQFSFVKRKMSWQASEQQLEKLDVVMFHPRVLPEHVTSFTSNGVRLGRVFCKIGRHTFFYKRA